MHAASYDEDLAKGISLSGEKRDFFVQGRIALLRRCLDAEGWRGAAAMDFGCGTGTSVPVLREVLGIGKVVGVDASDASIELARRAFGEAAEFSVLDMDRPGAVVDLIYCNGVFHHVPLTQRGEVLRHVVSCLKPGGILSLWENNPWSPAARWVMRRIPFDRGAVMLWPVEVRRLLRDEGMGVLRTDFLFIFPRALKMLRPIEETLSRWPLGAQYQVLAKKL